MLTFDNDGIRLQLLSKGEGLVRLNPRVVID